ncbi:hypothetical protein JMJ35_005225 [Cladonia borealis]|uniref:Heterokaryon incompatibility domain-containing protein n=1 Tax=Cladonia borealis TaxID=184061 RepID=A0AA39V1H5_9LECA|nr:hypothetical protein JMJ35_005225 [Cladonia borealis]
MDKASPYGYSSLPLDSIRLLCRDDGAGSSSNWSLSQHVLNDAPAFFALSYAWGAEKPTEKVNIKQSVLKITLSLSILLQELEARCDVCFIWIDQMCINQLDELEKAVQVKMMRDIYVSAQKVLVWLGPSTEGSNLAMDSIAPLDELIGVLPLDILAHDDINSRLLPGQDDPVWPALVDFYARPWYHRLWVLQEAILAKDLEVLCGNRSMPWATFASFATKLHELMPLAWSRASHAHPSYGAYDSAQPQLPGFVSIRIIDNMRSGEAEGSKPAFWEYLSMGQKCKVSNPLDRVYGLLGLLDSEELIRSIDIQYDWEPWQGYLHFCKVYIERDPDLALFSMAGSRSKPKELPSWCPNFDSMPHVGSIYCDYSGFCAGIKPGGPRNSRIQTSATSNTITVPGFRMDRVKAVTRATHPLPNSITPWKGPTGQAAKHEQYHLECLNVFKEAYPAMATDLQALLRSLVAGHLSRYQPLPAIDFSAVHFKLLDTWTAMASGGAIPRSSAKGLAVMGQWLGALSVQAFRRFFVTEAGRVGIGSGSIEKGDHVCVFYSAGPLFLLRYVDPDAPAELVGDAYVDGLMDLENMPGDTRGEDEVFKIC